jgi:dynein heavy chain
MSALSGELEELEDLSDMNQYREVIVQINDLNERMTQYHDDKNKMENEDMMMLGFKSNYENFDEVEKIFHPHLELWTAVSDFLSTKKAWNSFKMREMKHEEVDTLISSNYRKLKKIIKLIKGKPNQQKVYDNVIIEINELRDWLPTFEVLCNPGLQARHWEEIQTMVQADFSLKDLSFMEIRIYNIREHLDKIAQISDRSSKEFSLEKMLSKMTTEWQTLNFSLSEW